MSSSSSGFAQFRYSLQEAAAHSLERTHPNYVIIFQKALEETGDLEQALHAVNGISTDPEFAKWRPLLTATLDTELAMNEMRSALNLLKALPSEETLGMYSMSRGAWLYYHLNTWIFWMDALLEKQKTLVKEAVRALIRPRNTQWKDVEGSLLSIIDVLSKDMGTYATRWLTEDLTGGLRRRLVRNAYGNGLCFCKFHLTFARYWGQWLNTMLDGVINLNGLQY